MEAAVRQVYCVDTSSFVYCQRSFAERSTRRALFAPVWTLLDRLAGEGRLVAPHLVYTEITKNNDDIGAWAKAHAGVFRRKGEHATRVMQILREPGQRLVDPTAPRGGEEADPWVIALAEGLNAADPTLFDPPPAAVVVSEETRVGGISDICRRRGITHVDFAEMVTIEGLSIRW